MVGIGPTASPGLVAGAGTGATVAEGAGAAVTLELAVGVVGSSDVGSLVDSAVAETDALTDGKDLSSSSPCSTCTTAKPALADATAAAVTAATSRALPRLAGAGRDGGVTGAEYAGVGGGGGGCSVT